MLTGTPCSHHRGDRHPTRRGRGCDLGSHRPGSRNARDLPDHHQGRLQGRREVAEVTPVPPRRPTSRRPRDAPGRAPCPSRRETCDPGQRLARPRPRLPEQTRALPLPRLRIHQVRDLRPASGPAQHRRAAPAAAHWRLPWMPVAAASPRSAPFSVTPRPPSPRRSTPTCSRAQTAPHSTATPPTSSLARSGRLASTDQLTGSL